MGVRIDESVYRLFDHIERMRNDRIAKRVYAGECMGSRLVGQPQKMWIDSVSDFEKRNLNVEQARMMV